MALISVYTTKVCPYCIQAKRLLQSLGLDFQEIDLTHDQDLRERISREQNGYRTVPMIFVGKTFVGGYTDLKALVDQNKLKPLIDLETKA